MFPLGDNYEMIMTSFKTMTVIIRDGKEHKVSTKQLQILMTYVEEDIYDSSRQVSGEFNYLNLPVVFFP